MRDHRLIAAHRGGPLDRESHALLARWAVDCAARVLPIFTQFSGDDRPNQALKTGRAWADGEVKTGAAMKASVAAHAAARTVTDRAAIASARAAGQAVATAHLADHSVGALLYAAKALAIRGNDWQAELERQLARLPAHLREPVAAGIDLRLPRMGLTVTPAR